MIYAFIRALSKTALRAYYKVTTSGASPDVEGPVIFVGNHPNALVDAGFVVMTTRRHLTFLAKEPMFRTPLMGQVLRGIRALPVYRKEDNPGQLKGNEGTLEAAVRALTEGGAIMLFPEGRSHSEPRLATLKTGAARIALRAARQGVPVRIVPLGLTYEEKHRFRSEVLVEVGDVIAVRDFLPEEGEPEGSAAAALTDAIDAGLRRVTLNLERWEDLPLVRTAEALYAFRLGERDRDPARLRRFARGAQLLREEQPERFEWVRARLLEFHRRLALVRADPWDLKLIYRPTEVAWFVARNLAMLLVGLPLAAVGFLTFWLPYHIPGWIAGATKPELDMVATVKILTHLALTPLWLLLIFFASWWKLGAWAGLVTAAAVPLAIFTRWFVEHWEDTLRDIRVFFTLGSRARLKKLLLAEGERLSAELERLATELGPRVEVTAPVTG